MKNLKLLASAALITLAMLSASCAKEGICECTAVYSDSRADSTWQQIRPNLNKDCTVFEGTEYYGSYSADITCTKIN